MPNLNFSMDLHCHPNYKAFAKAHATDGQPPLRQSNQPAIIPAYDIMVRHG